MFDVRCWIFGARLSMIFHSIKWRLQAWHGFILVGLVSGLMSGFYAFERRGKLQTIDAALHEAVTPLLPRFAPAGGRGAGGRRSPPPDADAGPDDRRPPPPREPEDGPFPDAGPEGRRLPPPGAQEGRSPD